MLHEERFASTGPIAQGHDLVMFDLDGVLYRGAHGIDGAADHVRAIRDLGPAVAYVTNNASRSAGAVAEHLTELGIPAHPEEVVTSAIAVARMIAEDLPAGSAVVVLGAPELAHQVARQGLSPVAVDDPAARALVSGFGPDVVWEQILRAAVRIREGLPWYASNTDLSYPAAYGIAPGHGALVRMLSDFSGVTPLVAGKPEPGLLTSAAVRVGATSPLMVGDRPDTDIEGARRAGVPSYLVMTGVCDLEMLLAVPPAQRPDHLGDTLAGLLVPHPPTTARDGRWVNDHWSAWIESGELRTTTVPGTDPDTPVAADRRWQAIAAAAWDHVDRGGDVPGLAG